MTRGTKVTSVPSPAASARAFPAGCDAAALRVFCCVTSDLFFSLFLFQVVAINNAALVLAEYCTTDAVGAWPNATLPGWVEVTVPLLGIIAADRMFMTTLVQPADLGGYLEWAASPVRAVANQSAVPLYISNSTSHKLLPYVQSAPAPSMLIWLQTPALYTAPTRLYDELSEATRAQAVNQLLASRAPVLSGYVSLFTANSLALPGGAYTLPRLLPGCRMHPIVFGIVLRPCSDARSGAPIFHQTPPACSPPPCSRPTGPPSWPPPGWR